MIRSHAKTLGPKLQDHIHLTVGTADTFHLDEPARLLDQTLQELGIRAQFTYIEGRTHFDLYQGGLTIKIANEMEAVAHPKPAKPAVTRKPGNADIVGDASNRGDEACGRDLPHGLYCLSYIAHAT